MVLKNLIYYALDFKWLSIEMSLVKYSWVEKSQGKCFFHNLFQAYVVLEIQLGYSYIKCIDVSWPASCHDADAGN